MEPHHSPRAGSGASAAPGRSVLSGADIDRLTRRLFLREGMHRSAFWVLLGLSAVISGAGVVADSVATVIGAMIVAPLMTPILGTAFATVLALRRQVVASLAVVLGAALAVVAVGFLLGLIVPQDVVAATNSQVAARVSPKLIDLLAALATGVVGAFALVRSDVSDTLPGVAIAISLVPPLSVVGLTLESGAYGESFGALLLFATNVAAIIATGVAVLAGFRVRAVAVEAGWPVGRFGARTVAVIAGFVVLVSVPLGIGTYHVFEEVRVVARARTPVDGWAARQGLSVTGLAFANGVLQVTATGPRPPSAPDALRRTLDDAGLADVAARLTVVDGDIQDLPANG
ncbi:MAG: DUF389 domain-containing protein [Saccharothrix sp.]|nr:DUF389 domain-containing protein [Saccharothrix sp.]